MIRRHRVPGLACLLLLAGCISPTGPESRFGYSYRLVVTGGTPEAFGTSIVVGLEYSGCAGGHEFELRHRRGPGEPLTVWLRKVTPDEPCDMLITEHRSFLLPASPAGVTVVLVGPGNHRITVPKNPCSMGTGFLRAACSMGPYATPARRAVAT